MQPIRPITPADSRLWRILHFPLVLLVIGIAFMIAAGVAATAVSRGIGRVPDTPAVVLVAIIVAGIFYLAYWLFVRLIERRPVTEFGRERAGLELAAGIAIGVLLFSAVIGVIAALGGYSVSGTNPPTVFYGAAALSITSGVTEEIVARGLIFRLVESWLGSWIALIFSAALFGAGHLGNPNATVLAALAIALEAGVMLAAIYMVTRRLWAAIGLHAAWNFAQGGIFGVPVSGNADPGLLRSQLHGSVALTGGSFGAESSLTAVILCTTLGVALLVIAHRRGRFVAPFWRRARPDQPGLHE